MKHSYRVHLTRIDGSAINTPTGTLTYSHTYRRSNGKIYQPAFIKRKFNKRENPRGYKVARVEVYIFDNLI